MAKKLMGYQEGIGELIKGFDEDRVILVGQGKQEPPNPRRLVGARWVSFGENRSLRFS